MIDPSLKNAIQKQGNLSGTSISSATGSSQTLLAENLNRRFLLLQNIAATVWWINFDGVAAVADQPSYRMAVNETLRFDAGFIPVGAITGIGTGSSKLVVKEG